MRKSLFTEAQVIGILQRAFAGQPVTELCRELGITQQTFCTPSLSPVVI